MMKRTARDDYGNLRGTFNTNVISGCNKNYDNIKTNSDVFFLMSSQGITLEIRHGGAFDFTPD